MSGAAAAGAVFHARYPIRFSHCDPAGIVFFPHYLILTNHLVEDWLAARLGSSFAQLIATRRIGTPIVRLECDFIRPSRMGENLDFFLSPQRLGRRSLSFGIEAEGQGETRLRSVQTLATISLDSGRSIDLPADIAAACRPQEVADA